ncbi:xanthine dehydrogenase family protein molybdopterin-binding subunit (plasmid) [Tistrella bauzanensis]|uniref:Xanthine dehydrogenase family protein molybdopterin-binding subunit n=1 Tax=Tistrella arctica TaxID=3133430 RepID=A0ABU9YLI9_9PROT
MSPRDPTDTPDPAAGGQPRPPAPRSIGTPAPRVDGRAKVTGGAVYPADTPIAGLAHAMLVTAGIARGRLLRLDTTAATALDGVIGVLTHDDVAGRMETPRFGVAASSMAPLHDRMIRHDGQIIAVVVAETPEIAVEAAALLRPDYETEEPATGFDSPGAETVAAKDAAGRRDPAMGDVEAAFATAARVLEADYETPTQHHNAIELFSTTAVWDGDHLTVHDPSQNVNGWRHELARQLRIDPGRVRVVSTFVGGAFGGKGPMTGRTALIAFAARHVGRPLRCVATRAQGFTTTTYRAETRQTIRMAVDGEARITGFVHNGAEVTSRADPYLVGGNSVTGRLYGYGSVATRLDLVRADRATPGYMRSPPETPYLFALESAMDEMAEALSMDPIDFRRRNDTLIDPLTNRAYSSRMLMPCYDAAALAFGWADRDPRPGSMQDGDWLVGMGCASAVYPANIAAATARVRLLASGAVLVDTASHEIGTGLRTVASQMAAECLGAPLDAVTIQVGDSDLPPAPVSGGSNSTASVCSAIARACDAVRADLFARLTAPGAGPFAGMDAATLDLTDGRVTADGPSMSLHDAMAAAGIAAIDHLGEFVPDGMTPDAVDKLRQGGTPMRGGGSGDMARYAMGAVFAEIRIHRRTLDIRVPRMVGAFAAGRIMNPLTARSQLQGGMIWGLSAALMEETVLDRRAARIVNRDLENYLMPVNADIGAVDVILMPEHDTAGNPSGIKGLGELGNVGMTAAIANAVHHATGRRQRRLPIRPDRLFVATAPDRPDAT